MKFICDKAQLIAAIGTASLTVAQRSTIPALEGICLRAGMTLTLTGYNLETGITVEVPAEITEPGSCVLPSPLFGDIIRKLPDNDVNISVDDQLKVSIRSGISFFQILATSSEDFPDLPEVETQNSFSLPQKTLRSMIGGADFCVSTSQARPILTGCAFEMENNSLTAVSVDGYRLAMRREPVESHADAPVKFVIPAAGLREIERILKDSEDPASLSLGPKHILFEIDQIRLICRLLDGEFLDWRKVVPTDCPIKLIANVSDLTSSVERVGLIVSEKYKSPARCVFSNQVIQMRTNTTIGAAEDRCSIAGDGKELEIGFNVRYLLDALRVIPTEEVTLELTNNLSPIIMTPVDDKHDFAYMILPVRIKAN